MRRSTDDEVDSLKSDDEGLRKPVRFDDSLRVEYDNRGQCYGLRACKAPRDSTMVLLGPRLDPQPYLVYVAT
jgi:hypothetical protein